MNNIVSEIKNNIELLLNNFNYYTLIKISLIILVLIIVNRYTEYFLVNLKKKTKKSKNISRNTLINTIIPPVKTFINIICIISAADLILYIFEIKNFSLLISNLRLLSFVICITWFILNFINKTEASKIKIMTEDNRFNDRTTTRALAKLIKIFVLVSSGIICLDILGINISGLLTLAGVGTAIIGFASQDMISNFFGTLIIFLDKPFAEGDWISSPDKNIEGTVEEISWRMTRIRTFERRPIYVPNSIFLKSIIQNNTRMFNRRFRKVVTLRYQDLKIVPIITNKIKEFIDNNELIDQQQFKYVNLSDLNDYSVDIEIYCFTKSTNWIEFQAFQQNMLLEISNIIISHKADFAFPTTTLKLPDLQYLHESSKQS